MTRQERLDLYHDFLDHEGYRPAIDKDGDLMFKIEGKTYFVFVDEDDEEFFRLVFPNFWSIEDEDERARAYVAAHDATAQTKVAKVFVVKDDTWATLELFCDPPETVKAVLPRGLLAVQSAVDTFAQIMRA
jgi:hypothetical protein